MEQNTQSWDFSNVRDLLTVVFKHKYKVLVIFLGILSGALIFAFQIRPLYEAKSILLVKLGREFFQRPEGPSGGAAVGFETVMSSEISILTSRDLMAHVVKAIGPENLYPTAGNRPESVVSEEVAIKMFEEGLDVTGNSGLIRVMFTHGDPRLAAQAVNMLVDGFMSRHLEVFGARSTGFLEGQEKAFQERLRQSEGNLSSFKQKNAVFSFEEQKSTLIQQRATLDMSMKAAHNQISELEQRAVLIRSPKWTVEVSPETRVQTNALLQQATTLQQRLTTLQQQERESLQKYTESSSVVRNLRREIRFVKEAISQNSDEAREESKKSLDERRQIELAKVEGEMSIVKAKVDSLGRQFAQVEADIRSLDARGRELQDLKREVALQEDNYKVYSQKLEESQIMDDMDRRKMIAISVLEKATPSAVPKKLKLGKTKMIAGGFLGGLAAGIALAFLIEFMAPGMTTPLSAERRLGIPVMVTIAKKC
jgi:polysaccharide biosynthesis protein PslE